MTRLAFANAEEGLAFNLKAGGFEFLTQVEYIPGRKFRADFLVYGNTITLEPGPVVLPLKRPRVLVEVWGGIAPFKRTRKDGQVVEQAGAHGSVTGILKDIERLNEAMIAGFDVLRFTTKQVDDGYAMTTIRRYFEGA